MANSRVTIRADLSALRKDIQGSSGLTEGEAKKMVISLERRLKAAEAAAKSAAKAQRDVTKAIQASVKAAAAAEKSGATAARGWAAAAQAIQQNQLVSEMETVLSLGIQVGGTFSRIAAVATSMVRPVALAATVIGPVGLGLAAAAAAGPVAILALKGFADRANEARGRLEKLNLEVNKADARNLKIYERATTDLGIAVDRLTVAMGAELAPAFATVAASLAALVRDYTNVIRATVEFRGQIQTATRAVVALGSVGLSEAALAIVNYGARANEAEQYTKTLTKAVEELEEASRKAAAENMELVANQDEREGARQQRMADERARKAQAARDKRLRELEAIRQANLRLEQIERAVSAKAVEDEKKIQAEYDERVAGINEIARAGADADRVSSALAAAESARQRQLAALEIKRAEEAKRAAEEREAAEQKYQQSLDNTARGLARISSSMESIRKNYNADIRDAILSTVEVATQAALGTALQLGQMELDNDLEVLDKRRAALEKFTDRRKELREEYAAATSSTQRAEIKEDLEVNKVRINNAKNSAIMARNAALKQFEDNKKLQIAQTLANAASAAAMTLAVTPLPPPLNLAAAAVTSGAALAELAVIRKTKPSFHEGGVVRGASRGSGEVDATLLEEEGVLNRGAMSDIGGEQGLRRLNNREGFGGDVVVHSTLMLDGRVAARSTERHRRGRSRRNFHAERG